MGLIVDITTRCNMLCVHCMWSRTKQGEDMSLETFRAALDMTPVRGHGTLSLGTGEPTVHPQFWEFVEMGLHDVRWTVRVVTNGKATQTSLRLAEMARTGLLEAHLSLDKWHDPIDPTVVEAFKRGSDPRDRRAYRICRDEDLKNTGRCDFGPEQRPTCRCPVPKVRPNGDVYWCGCEGAQKIGDVRAGWDRKLVARGPAFLECEGFKDGNDNRKNDRFFVRLRTAIVEGGHRG